MSTAEPIRIRIVNDIAAAGLRRFPAERYRVAKDLDAPHAILLRSADLHAVPIASSVLAIARAGAGTNNIPVAALSQRGVPVFNAPGANANAVKELVLAGMLMAQRRLPEALRFVDALPADSPDLERIVEDGKKSFAGTELCGQTLGVIGLGRVGCLVADAAIKLGMQVIGYDPEITVDAAWSLPSQVRKAGSLGDLMRNADVVSVHVPLVAATRGLIDAARIGLMPRGGVLVNFARDAVVDDEAVLAAIETGQLSRYVCDFPSARLHRRAGVIALPHLGASTRQAEENCAVMVADQLIDYLEHGNVRHAVNFPEAVMPRESNDRVVIANSNVPNMLGQISTAMAAANLNIHNMLNRSRGEMAYTIVDVDSAVPDETLASIKAIDGVLSVRYLPLR